MPSVFIPRSTRHHGATGKTLQRTLPVGTMTHMGRVLQVRRKKKFPNRYRVVNERGWFSRDDLRVLGGGDKHG